MAELEFFIPQLEDKDTLAPMLYASGENTCSITLANLLVWGKLLNYSVAVSGDNVFVKTVLDGVEYISLPIGGNYEEGIKTLNEYLAHTTPKPYIWALQGKSFDAFMAKEGKNYTVQKIRDYYEYLYGYEDLANLVGKKFHSKRNYINVFTKLYDWQYERINEDNLPEVYDLLDKWYKSNSEKLGTSTRVEREGVHLVLDNPDVFDTVGALIRVDGMPVAFTAGCPINDQTFDVMYEKALPEYMGAYPFINNQFVKNELSQYKYINREDDMGLAGLRKAKLSYNPQILLERYVLVNNQNAKRQAAALFADTFEDESEQSAKRFIENFFDNGLYRFENGKLVSMLFLLPARVDGIKVYYLYGAATAKEYRKKGYMTSLIDEAKAYAKQHGVNSIILRPADKYSQDLYSANGFVYNRFVTLYKAQKSAVTEEYNINLVASAKEYANLRGKYLQNGDIAWDEECVKVALDNGSGAPCSAFYGTVGCNDFCCVCEKRGDTLYVREFFGVLPGKACNALIEFTGCNSCVAVLRAEDKPSPHTMEYCVDGTKPEPGGYTGIALD